jgi:hypothetical protein
MAAPQAGQAPPYGSLPADALRGAPGYTPDVLLTVAAAPVDALPQTMVGGGLLPGHVNVVHPSGCRQWMLTGAPENVLHVDIANSGDEARDQ